MPDSQDILWFKQQFRGEIEAAVKGTPFTLDMLAAFACQETGEVWPVLRKADLDVARILELCVGDTIDARPDGKGRRAFPKNKAELVAAPQGPEMFDVARQALVEMAQFIKSYAGAAANPNKFCHGYGIFQLDLQFFKTEPDYFLQKRYAVFSECLSKCLGELRSAQKRAGLEGKTTLTDLEMAGVAIAYNTGRFDPSKGLKQGFKDSEGKFYGENFFEFLRLAHTVVVPEVVVVGKPPTQGGKGTPPPQPPTTGTPPPTPGPALVPPPTPVGATGRVFTVDVRKDPLNLREKPNKTAAVKARLPDGQLVQAVTGKQVNGFLEVETSLRGAHLRGFVAAEFLKPAKGVKSVPVTAPAPAHAGTTRGAVTASALPVVFMPRKAGTVTRRADPAGAHSLNEPKQPDGRKGATPEELRAELEAVIDWLAVDRKSHKRYQPHDGLTYCNVYAHDYCHLSGVYLPRVWWSQAAVERLAQGQAVEPLLGDTIDEVRANDLFRWLRDFGLRFGWRRADDLAELQQDVNLGAVGLVVALRKADGLSGHITAVVPETNDLTAKRDARGEVVAPVQSQAGSTNFRRGTGKPQWWLDERFADHAFWVHA